MKRPVLILNITEVGAQPVVTIVFQMIRFRSLWQYLLSYCELWWRYLNIQSGYPMPRTGTALSAVLPNDY
jgi:hypothetical protein